MRYYTDIAHSNGDGFIITSTLAQKRDLGTKAAETSGTDWGGGLGGQTGLREKERQKQMKKDLHERNNKQAAGGKDVECEGRGELVLR